MDDLRAACASVARRATDVAIVPSAIATAYARDRPRAVPDAPSHPPTAEPERERLAARWLTLDAINFGSGWFPTLRKRPGMSGARTIAAALTERFETHGPWTAPQLTEIEAAGLAGVLHQDPGHELIGLYAAALRELGAAVQTEHAGSFAAVVDAAAGSAVSLARRLGSWNCFADRSRYDELELPFLKRAQIAAADLHRAGVAHFADLDRLTMFADNLVPHVLRVDGVLRYSSRLLARIQREELLEHGSPEEVEIRACAVHAVELLVAAGAGSCPAQLDEALWHRGQLARYKALPRHRCRTTAY
ncbi:MAG: queuosine salvage family protein [Solirubrobacteraceae bacterium]